MSEIKFEIIKKIGVLSKTASGWTKEVNLMSWNDRDPKYDIRECQAMRPQAAIAYICVTRRRCSPDRQKMGKGVTLSKEELLALKELLNTVEL